MPEDLNQLGEDLVTTAGRFVRWVPTGTFTMSLASARILARLADTGPSRISDLATLEHCSQPTITNHVQRLESHHLVERRTDPADARASMISVTGRGTDQLGKMRKTVGDSIEPQLAALSPRDLKALRQGIEALRRLMTADRLRG